jgi:hypothetical protein
MPGLDYFSKTENVAAPVNAAPVDLNVMETTVEEPTNVYYNPRLDPKNFVEGPLSYNPSTRLRQMLARPGIIVSIFYKSHWTPISHN